MFVLIYLAIGTDFMTKLLRNVQYVVSAQGYYYADCDTTKYYDVYIRVGGYWTVVKPSNYIIPYPSSNYSPKCPIMFTINPYDIWIMGDAFLRNYYSYYDMENL